MTLTLAKRWVSCAAALLLVGLVALVPAGKALAVPSACMLDPSDVGLMAVRIAGAGTGVGGRIVGTDRVVVGAYRGGEFSSDDGGYTWLPVPFSGGGACSYLNTYEWDDSVTTPRGIYSTEDGGVVLATGNSRKVVYSTKFLAEPNNKWQQAFATRRYGDRVLTTGPVGGIVYHEATENVVLPMGFLGVLVGDPDGNWHRVSVGPFSAMDFSIAGKVRLVFGEPHLWLSALTLAVLIAVSFVLLLRVVALRRWMRGLLITAVALPPSVLAIDGGVWVPDLYLSYWNISAPALTGLFLVAILVLPRVNTPMGWLGIILLASVVGLALGFVAMYLTFIAKDELGGIEVSHIQIGLAAIGIILAGLVIAQSMRRLAEHRHLPIAAAGLGMTASILTIAFVIAMSYFYLGHSMVYLIVLIGVAILALMIDNRYSGTSLAVWRRGH